MNLHYFILASALGFLSLSATPSVASSLEIPVEKNAPEYIQLRGDRLPVVRLSGEIVYRVLLGEIAAQREDFDTASQVYVSLAQDTSDPRFAQLGFQLAMLDGNLNRGLEASQLWSLLAPKNPEAKATALAIEASVGDTSGLAAALRDRIDKASDKEQAIIQSLSIVNKMVDPNLAFEVLEKALPAELGDLAIAHLALADAAWSARRPERAFNEAKQALTLLPDSEAAAQRVLEYGLRVNESEAMEAGLAFIAEYPETRQMHFLVMNRLVDVQQYDEALALVARMRQRHPEDFDLLYTEAEINTRAGRYTQAKSLLNDFITVQSQRRSTVRDQSSDALTSISDARLALVQIAEQEQDYVEAIHQLNAIEEPELRFQAAVHRAVLEARIGDMRKAQRTLDSVAVQDKQEQAVIVLTRASILRSSGRSDEAVEVLERGNRELLDVPEIKYDLAMLYEKRGNFDGFETLMREIIEIQPDDANAYNALGYTFADQARNLEEAQNLLEQAFELEPDNPYILDSIGWYLYRIGDLTGAAEYLERSFQQLQEAEVAAHLGEVYWVNGRHKEAKAIWAEALDMDATNQTLLETLKRFDVTLP